MIRGKAKGVMRKTAVLLFVCLVLALSGCQGGPSVNRGVKKGSGTAKGNPPDDVRAETGEAPERTARGDVVVIKEKLFVAQTNDIYFNRKDYLGKTIKYEGIFSVYKVPETGEVYRSVIRYGPGCCGVDTNPGFEVAWDKGYPKEGDWVEAVGVLEEYTEGDAKLLRLALSSLTVLPKRGAENVSQ